jgi:hypothetical protein
MIVFAGIGAIVLTTLILRLPDDTPKTTARGAIVSYPVVGSGGPDLPTNENEPRKLAWRDPRVLPWYGIGAVGGHGQAALLGVIGFLVIDRLHLPLDHAQQWIAIVMISGAGASLLAQWWLIPQLALEPRQLVIWGSLVAAVGTAVTGLSTTVYGIVMGFALASLGFGFFRPGFTSGASLAVGPDEQNAVAGIVTSVNGLAYVAAPSAGVALYGLNHPAPFLATAVLMLALAAWTGLAFRPSRLST